MVRFIFELCMSNRILGGLFATLESSDNDGAEPIRLRRSCNDVSGIRIVKFKPCPNRIELLVITLLVWIWFSSSVQSDDLVHGFRHPPHSAGIRAFWWWLNGNVTQESITRDLEQMKAKGFNGALIFDADVVARGTIMEFQPGQRLDQSDGQNYWFMV